MLGPAAVLIPIFVACSTFGAANGSCFTGGRSDCFLVVSYFSGSSCLWQMISMGGRAREIKQILKLIYFVTLISNGFLYK